MVRSEHLHRLHTETFDLCVIGGGASGAGCALDAALRGLKVCLIERDDFAAATSSRSTKLIHGGVRYLEQAFKNFDFAQLRQVRHGLEERHLVLANAPHLARPLGLLTPVGSWVEGLYFRIGLWLYDRFASSGDSLPKSRWLSRRQMLDRIPTLNPRNHSAVLYYDGQLDDARYALALVQSAAEAGAVVVNHAEVIGFQKNNAGLLQAAQVKDRLAPDATPGWVNAKLFLNCAGPYADHLRLLANPAVAPRIRPSKGVHVILPLDVLGSTGGDALLIPKTPDGRVVFAIPFAGELLLGTTDTEYHSLEDEPLLTAAEVDFLLETLEPYLSKPVDKQRVKSGFGGLRPLITANSAASGDTKSLLRDHEVERDRDSGLLSLLGGKWTTYRLMARDAVDVACAVLGEKTPCRTAEHRLAGGENFDPNGWQTLQKTWGWPENICRHLHHNYGSRAAQVAELTREQPDLGTALLPSQPYLRAEVVWAARVEMCCTVRDFVARRIRLEISDWAMAHAAASPVARLLGAELGWSTEEESRQVLEYEALVSHFMQTAGNR